MPFFGRYHLVREWWLPDGSLSPLLVLDRRDKTLHRYLGSVDARVEWQPHIDQREAVRKWQRFRERVAAEPTARRQRRLAERLARQYGDCGRIAALFGSSDLIPIQLLDDWSTATTTAVGLDSLYVAGTSGDAIAARYWSPPGGKTLSSVYYFIASYNGTAANVNDIDLELRPESSTGSPIPNTGSLTEAKTSDPASALGWIAVTGWTSVLAALSRNVIIVGDADGNITDFANVNHRTTGFGSIPAGVGHGMFTAVLTTGGWATGNSVTNAVVPCFVLGFSDGTAFGNPLSANTAPASDTNRRGVRITALGLIASVPIFGTTWGSSANASISGIEIYNNANVPGTSPDHTSAEIIYANATRNGCFTSAAAPYTLAAGTAYRIVATYSGATTAGPQRMDIGTGEDATLRKAMQGKGEWYYSRANGTTDWSNDLVGSLPSMGLLVDEQVAASGSGGGMRLAGHGGLAT